MIPKIPTRADFRGRFGDTASAHVTPGEIVIPTSVTENPQAMAAIARAFQSVGMDHRRYTVGSPEASVNPDTGMEEFFDWRSIAGAFLPGLVSDFLPGDIFDSDLLNRALDVGLGAAANKFVTGSDWTGALGASLGNQAGRSLGGKFGGTDVAPDATQPDTSPISSTGNAQLDALFTRNQSFDPTATNVLGQSLPANMTSAPSDFNAFDFAASLPQSQQSSVLRDLGLGDLDLSNMLFGAGGAFLGQQLASGGLLATPEQQQLQIPNMPTASVPQYNPQSGASMSLPKPAASAPSSTQIGTQTSISPSTSIGTGSTGAMSSSGITYQRPLRDRNTGRVQFQNASGPGRQDRRQGWGGGVTFI